MKIVINRCFGGFGLSKKAYKRLTELGIPVNSVWNQAGRSNKLLIQVIEELGKEADGSFAKLKIVEVPDDVKWRIQEYDGIEWIAERYRTWS